MKSISEKQLLLDQLKKTPIIQIACEKTGIGRSTYYHWIAKDPEFKKQSEKAVRKGTLLVNDLAESQLISAIKDKNITAIIFWLKNNNPKYSERKINLTAKEMGEIINAVISSDPEYTLKLLTQRLIEGKIPRFFVNTLNSIISKSIKVNQLKVDAQKVKLLNQFS